MKSHSLKSQPMAPQLLLSSLLFFLLTTSAAVPANPKNSTEFIRTSCTSTLYPALCFRSLSRYSNTIQLNPVNLARAAANISLAHVRSLSFHISSLSQASSWTGQAAAALHDCIESMGDATDQIQQSMDEIRHLEAAMGPEVAWRVANVQTWMSAALTNEDTCAEGFDGMHAGAVKADVCGRVQRAKRYTSNALALVNCLVACH